MTGPSQPDAVGPLRVFVDGSILKPHLGGIATYTIGLTNALSRCPGVQVCIATSTVADLTPSPTLEVIPLSVAVRNFVARAVWRERTLHKLVVAHNASLVLAPTVELPVRKLSVPGVMVVHDLGAARLPGLYGRLRWARFVAGLPLALRRAERIVCVSHATRAVLGEAYPSYAEKCTVIGEAGRAFVPAPWKSARPPYVLAVGTMLPHKNVATLVRAMDEPELRGVDLILAGPVTRRQMKLLAKWCGSLGAPSRIRHLGFVDLDRLSQLYAHAAVVALPSLHEGFGLTLLEAMRCGTPAVASPIPAHRELGGDAVAYVAEPCSPTAWAQTLASVIRDGKRASRLSRSGRERAARATWLSIATQMATCMRDVLEARPT